MSENYPDFAETNKVIAASTDLLELVARPDLDRVLSTLDYNWRANQANPASPLIATFERHGFVERSGNEVGMTRQGILFLSRLLLRPSASSPEMLGILDAKYEATSIIAVGKNSIVVAAVHRLLRSRFVLKLVRPGASNDMLRSVGLLSGLPDDASILKPIDLVNTTLVDALGREVDVQCLVFPFAEGVTFKEFLARDNRHLNSQVAIAFARQVGSGLAALEEVGAYHGDLHEGNIIVDEREARLRFTIIDISFDAMGSVSSEICRNNDLSNFKQHIWRLLAAQRASVPRSSLRKYIGTKSYRRLEQILSPDTNSFKRICEILQDERDYERYLEEKERFLGERFHDPVSFRLQRYEEMTDPEMAVRLFVPLEQLMDKIQGFSNVYVSGNRGSGKSTYLASLGFFPAAATGTVDFREIFGIYFPCRQGEFRPLAKRAEWSDETCRVLIMNLIIVKIVRRTLEVISAGVTSNRLRQAVSLDGLRNFLDDLVPRPGLVSVDLAVQSELDNLVASMIRVEMDEIAKLERPITIAARHDALTLIRFLETVRQTFPELTRTRFQILFDDAGTPYVPLNVQAVINDLMLSSNPVFCVKLSAEKLTFRFLSSDGKALEEGQDYLERDISQILFIGSGAGGLKREDLELYFRKIVQQRLEAFNYAATDIVRYLGDEQISHEKLLQLLAMRAKNAYYSGWTTVWNIADRTPRNLLELVSEIFAVAGIDKDSDPKVVSPRDQDRAIRTISEKRLESLSQIPGAVMIRGKEVSLGRRLFTTTSAIGSTFGIYLRAERGRGRKRQQLAIERNDLEELHHEAEVMLERLITFGILDATKLQWARDDNVKKPLYVLNRIFCPAFGIGYQRDEHLKLSKGRLEQLLVTPERFIRDGTRLLRETATTHTTDLFHYKDHP
ncbi:protein kinase family protein [Mesorhizobium sp. M00.F.Ca.ET.170.01.1.1]|nr:protein kinase family protein [Mesorhizobium sp. M00.F.Ca.ET.170.01.1.1]